MGIVTENEKETLVKFQNRLGDIDLSRGIFREMHLIRWLRARDMSIPKAEAMLRKHLEWRELHDIDTILYSGVSQSLKDEFAYEHCGYDNEGRPVLVAQYGKWDVRRAIVTNGLKKDVIQMINLYFEEIFGLIEAASDGKTFKQCSVIIDLEGLAFRQFTSVEIADTIVTCVRAFEANYPEFLGTAFCVNAPSIFSILWGMVKPFLSVHTVKKIKIFGSEKQKYKAELLQQIPADQFPVKYGGVSNTKLCNSDHIIQRKASLWNDDDGFSCAGEDLESVTVGASDKLILEYDIVVPETVLSWIFKSDKFDIGFSLVLNQVNDEIVKYHRVDSHVEKQMGSVICSKVGRYSLCFDNTYSRMRSKVLHYSVHLTVPEDHEDEKFSDL